MAQTPKQAFEAQLRERLRDRAALILATDQTAIAELAAAREQILAMLAAQPADWHQWQLRTLLDQIDAVLQGAGGRAAAAVDGGIRTAWQQGEDFVDKPLAAGGINIEIQLPTLNVEVLQQLRTFAQLRLKDVATEATTKIGRHLSLVTLGAQTPFEAIKAVQAQLGNESPRRATTIVRTEVGRAFAVAQFERLKQAAQLVPGLQKKWRRSGKIHSRWNHDAIDGQVRDVNEPFVLPSNEGTVKMMFPHDPQAPAAEVINCGCIAMPHRGTWQTMHPGAKPFSEQEKALDHSKGMAAIAAQRAGLRREDPPYVAPASQGGASYQAALSGGAHSGWLRRMQDDGLVQLQGTERSLVKLLEEHASWIAYPSGVVADWDTRSARYRAGLLAKWQKDIRRQGEHLDIVRGLIRSKEPKNG